jgi:hypothetical protein
LRLYTPPKVKLCTLLQKETEAVNSAIRFKLITQRSTAIKERLTINDHWIERVILILPRFNVAYALQPRLV